MCGIVGLFGVIQVKEEKVFRTLLELDTIRGHHSTGVIAVDRGGRIRHEKFLGTPWEFFKQTKMFSQTGSYKGSAKCLIGHNRYATMGKIDAENAHPFDFDNVIGVHNGTLRGNWKKDLKEFGEFDVDSKGIYCAINNVGLKEAISKIHGAWSLVMYDKGEKKIKFLRNKDRPMCYAYTKDSKTVVFASEEWMIEVACRKHGLAIKNVNKTHENQLFEGDLTKESFPDPDHVDFIYYKAKIEGKEKMTPSDYVYNYRNYPQTNFFKKGGNRTPKVIGGNKGCSSSTAMESFRACISEAKNSEGYLALIYNPDINFPETNHLMFKTITCKGDKDVKVIFPSSSGFEEVNRFKRVDKFIAVRANTFQLNSEWPNGLVHAHANSLYMYLDPYGLEAPTPLMDYSLYPKFCSKAVLDHVNSGKDITPLEEQEVEEDSSPFLDDEIPFEDYEELIEGYQGSRITLEQYLSITDKGCAVCGTAGWDKHDAKDLAWFDKDTFVCKECAKDEEMKQTLGIAM